MCRSRAEIWQLLQPQALSTDSIDTPHCSTSSKMHKQFQWTVLAKLEAPGIAVLVLFSEPTASQKVWSGQISQTGQTWLASHKKTAASTATMMAFKKPACKPATRSLCVSARSFGLSNALKGRTEAAHGVLTTAQMSIAKERPICRLLFGTTAVLDAALA